MSKPRFSLPHRLSLLIVLILATTWVRLWRFPEMPPAFNYDEAYNAVDTLWLWKTSTFLPFLPGNTGRQALFHYLTIPFMLLFGINIFAIRFVSVVIGILTVALMYRGVVAMFAEDPERHFLGLIAGAGLSFSFWYIALSRSGFRASLLLLLFILTIYLFWQGWQRQSAWYIVGAGVTLGLSQYTYWLAMLLPLLFGLFALIWTFFRLRETSNVQTYHTYKIKQIWLWLGIMAVASFVVFIPLGLQYLNTPSVLGYVTQSSITEKMSATEQTTWTEHLLNSIRIFVDGPATLWQGRISQSLYFDWIVLIGFWLGLWIAIKRRRQPVYLFLLIGLFVLWLPAPLNDINFSDLRLPDMLPVHHAISNLRLAGMLPIYYTLVAIGLLSGIQWLGRRLSPLRKPNVAGATAFILIFVISGGLNIYNFFVRWPEQPFLYERYNGPILDLARDLVRESSNRDILIPFHLYAHPTMHFFLDRVFTESDKPPLAFSHRSAILVTTSESTFSAYMWLVRPEVGPGIAYLTPTQDVNELLSLSSGEVIRTFNLAAPLMITAQTTLISDLKTLRPKLADWPTLAQVNYTWNDEIRLVGYQITPPWTQPGQSLTIPLYWQNLVDQPLTHNVFLHAVNSRGEGVGQVDGIELTDGHRWRAGKLTPTHHTLQLGNQLTPGPYLIRLGLFNPKTGARLPVSDVEGKTLGEQVLFGLFYVVEDERNPTQPTTPLQATLGQQIQFLGYDLLSETDQSSNRRQASETQLNLKTYWQAIRPVDGNYTIFLQLLDSQNQLVAGYDTQPLNNNYPTSKWQVSEVVVERIDLPLPTQISPGDYRLMTGMYDLQTGQRQLATDAQGKPLNDNMITLANVHVSSEEIIIDAP